MGLFAGGFGTVAVTDHRLIAACPHEWSFAQAATVPITFSRLLRACGFWRACSGARGCWCMPQLVVSVWLPCSSPNIWGAEVFGTASPGKWQTLRSLGLDEAHIAFLSHA